MTAYIYLRISTQGQGDSKNGLEAQESACRAVAAGLNAQKIVVDYDIISGASEIEDRPALTRILTTIKSGDALIVGKRDRIAREPRLMGFVEWTLQKKKAALYDAAGQGSSLPEHDMSGIIQRGMYDLFAKIERALIRTRTKDALQAKKARGERVGAIPYGFELKSDGQHVMEGTGERRFPKCRGRECDGCLNLQPSPNEVKIINYIQNLSKTFSTRTVAKILNDEGILSRTGNSWSKTQIIRILYAQKSDHSEYTDGIRGEANYEISASETHGGEISNELSLGLAIHGRED